LPRNERTRHRSRSRPGICCAQAPPRRRVRPARKRARSRGRAGIAPQAVSPMRVWSD
jgi:hypothetical protein